MPKLSNKEKSKVIQYLVAKKGLTYEDAVAVYSTTAQKKRAKLLREAMGEKA